MKRFLALFFSAAFVIAAASAVAQAQSHLPGTTPLYRYYNSHSLVGDHFYTIVDRGPSIPGGAGSSWVFENIECQIFPSAQTGTTPLYRYWNPVAGDHFYTIDINELGASGSNGYSFEQIEGYVFATPATGSVPLYRYYHVQTADHFYTVNFNTLGDGSFDGPSGWLFERIECWVSP
jgi:hypothetical protein